MSKNLDVHILMMEYTKKDWAEQCLASVQEAIDRAGFPVYLHLLPGIPGHIGKGRSMGYSRGNASWKTYVDDDDYLLPNAFALMKDSMDSGTEAIFSKELMWQNGYTFDGYPRHHLIAYRKEVTESFDQTSWVVAGDLAMARSVDGIDLLEAGYVHRLHESGGRVLRRSHVEENRRAARAKSFV